MFIRFAAHNLIPTNCQRSHRGDLSCRIGGGVVYALERRPKVWFKHSTRHVFTDQIKGDEYQSRYCFQYSFK